MVAALASGPEPPERHEVMPMAAHATAAMRRIRLCMSNLLLIPNTVYRRGAWNQLGIEPKGNG